MQDLEGYDEMEDKFIRSLPPERRLAGITPKERVAGLSPEERLAGLAPEERLAVLVGMPDDFLRTLSAETLAKLPPEIREAIFARIR